jgi:hypothetical protein
MLPLIDLLLSLGELLQINAFLKIKWGPLSPSSVMRNGTWVPSDLCCYKPKPVIEVILLDTAIQLLGFTWVIDCTILLCWRSSFTKQISPQSLMRSDESLLSDRTFYHHRSDWLLPTFQMETATISNACLRLFVEKIWKVWSNALRAWLVASSSSWAMKSTVLRMWLCV